MNLSVSAAKGQLLDVVVKYGLTSVELPINALLLFIAVLEYKRFLPGPLLCPANLHCTDGWCS